MDAMMKLREEMDELEHSFKEKRANFDKMNDEKDQYEA